MGKTGVEPVRLSARDSKSRLSASSSTSPSGKHLQVKFIRAIAFALVDRGNPTSLCGEIALNRLPGWNYILSVGGRQ